MGAFDECALQIVVMMVTILTVFGICWLPYQVAILYNEYRADQLLPVPTAFVI